MNKAMKYGSTDQTGAATTCKEDELSSRSRKGIEVHGKKKLKRFTLLHLMFAAQMLFIFSILFKARNFIPSASERAGFVLIPVLQGAWVAAVTYLGSKHQLFLRPRVYKTFPIFWLPMFVASVQLGIFAAFHETTVNILNYLPRSTFVGLQVLRVLAVGSLLKWYLGIFPTRFAWFTAFPDMLFGISAVFLLLQGSWIDDDRFLATWNLIGLAIIVPTGATILQLGMEPTQLYKSKVPNYTVFEYPMVLGPAAVVPVLFSWNLIVAVWAIANSNEA